MLDFCKLFTHEEHGLRGEIVKKILKSLGICLGVVLINQLLISVGIFIMGAANGVYKSFNDPNKYILIVALIGDLITIILAHLMLSVYDKKLLSKDLFKKVNLNKLVYISLFGIGLSVILLSITGMLTKLIPSYMEVQNQLQSASNSFLQIIIVIILIPICEEIIYRYVIFGHLKKNYNIVCAVIVQALIFGVAHGNIVQGIYTFILGIALALIYMYSDSLTGSIILHIVFNLMGVVIIPKLVVISPILSYVTLIVGIVCLIYSLFKIMKKYEAVLYK